MNNIFNFNKPVKHVGRNGFDNSFSRVIKMRPSFIRPIKAFDTVPNSSYKISVSDLVRTSALQTAAFLRGKQELDVYFVPYSQLYSRANDVVLSRGEDNSASIASLSSTSFPHVPLSYLVYHASAPYIFLRVIRYLQTKLNQGVDIEYSQPVENMLDLSSYAAEFIERVYGYEPFRSLELFVYNKEFHYPLPLTTDYKFYVEIINSCIESSEFIGADSLQLLSTLDYGDYYSLIKDVMDNFFDSNDVKEIERDFFSSDWNYFLSCFFLVLRTLRGVLSNFFLTISGGQLDILHPAQIDYQPVSLVHLAAYQKVWRDCYRDSINDESSVYLFASNLDYDFSVLFTVGGAPSPTLDPLLSYLRPRLRTMKRDLSNGIYANTQFGEAPSAYDYSASDLNIPDSLRPDDPGSAVSIKFVLAMQRYQQTLLRAGNRTKDLLLAEFGVKSHYIDDNYPKHVGSFDGALDLNKVTATAETGTYSVGDLAGNVFSSLQGKELEFTCNDHGVLVFMLSFICDPLHNAFGLSPFNQKLETFDFYKEDFENLGLQPVSSSVFSPFVFDDSHEDNYTFVPKILGYSARYNEYKQQIDTVHDTFCTHCISPNLENVESRKYTMSVNGVNTNYVLVRDLVQTLSNLKDRSYLMPSCMDTIFKSLDTGFPEDSHFDVALSVELKSILPMSTLGLI